MQLDIASLHAAYTSGSLTPSALIARICGQIEAAGLRPIWITLVPPGEALARAHALESGNRDLPLWGIPFAVKDNIDVAGLPTTAGCPDFAYTPEQTAPVVARLLEAGAILIGKTNLDQFATGLVGVRSPYGACSSVFDDRYISGGSSSGSAVAVARQLVSFALGTDTAGSGRVPAAFNNLVGLKPTRGLLSTRGIVPACRTLDCVSIFASSVGDARKAFDAAQAFDPGDPFSREFSPSPLRPDPPFRFGIPAAAQLQFFGDDEARALFQAAVARAESLGGIGVEIDFEPFAEAAALLYSGPWVAERLAAIEPFLRAHPESMHPIVRQIISGADRFSAADSFRAAYRLAELKRATETTWAAVDLLLLPTAPTTYTLEQVENEPIQLNTNLGYYTNFVNLLDLAAIAVPAGFRPNGLPFGISLIAPAFSDRALLALAARFNTEPAPVTSDTGFIHVAVVGAHLSGQPLNHQLTSRGARLVRSCRTAPDYRLYALAGTVPPKPGLIRDLDFKGPGIEVEVWSVPTAQFGSFVAAVPAPLGIGTCTLEDGFAVKSFICEPFAIPTAQEITHFGGWRAYLKQL